MRTIAAALLLTVLAGPTLAQDPLEPPTGARKLLEFSARGVQIYICRKTADQAGNAVFAWVFEAPEAVLLDASGAQAGTHSKGPSWALKDGSAVTGEVIAKAPAPEPGAIPWLLLKVTSHKGTGGLDGASFIRRVNTSGGVAPQAVCDDAHEGSAASVSYTATYQFFGL